MGMRHGSLRWKLQKRGPDFLDACLLHWPVPSAFEDNSELLQALSINALNTGRKRLSILSFSK
jgi:hypothetical protein